MKKWTILVASIALLVMVGCTSSEEVIEKTTVEIKENKEYTIPSNPSDVQAELYNSLTTAISSKDEVAMVSLIAQNFSADFFSLKNKTAPDDIGGTTYLPSQLVEAFKDLATNQVYSNYQTIIDDLGKSQLPLVAEVQVDTPVASNIHFAYTIPADSEKQTEAQTIDEEYEGYEVDVTITYNETKVPSNQLKTKATYSIIKLDERWVIVAMN